MVKFNREFIFCPRLSKRRLFIAFKATARLEYVKSYEKNRRFRGVL